MKDPINRGFYLMHRGWLDHPLLATGEFCKRAAWASLIDMASHRDQKGLQRGQLTVTYERLALYWGWSKSRVHRFIGSLQKHDMIVLQTRDRKPSLLTICNYDEYQRPEKTPPAPTETQLNKLVAIDRNTNDTPYNTLNQNQELKNTDIQDQQRLEELFAVLYRSIVHPNDAPDLKDLTEPRRWFRQYDWDNFVIPTISKWEMRNRARAYPKPIRSWKYFTPMLEQAFQKQRNTYI